MRIFLPLCAILLLSACVAPLHPTVSRKSSSPAVLNLMDQASVASDEAQYSLAKSKLERALRLEGNNPWLWLELAEVNKREGNLDVAKSLVLRAKGLSSDTLFLRQADRFISSL